MSATPAAVDIHPFRIDVPRAELEDLSRRLGAARWPHELAGVGWDYGVPLPYLVELSEYWRDGYDWRRQEAQLNQLPQFTTTIDGARVHFVLIRSGEPDALPLIITHGWPGSFVEFLEIIEPLTDPRGHGGDPADAFDLVLPSIPGFGFSGPTVDRGWDMGRVAGAWAELMRRLGYDRYGAQGGDWGFRISWELGRMDPKHVAAVHVNMLVPAVPEDVDESEITQEEHLRLARRQRFLSEGGAYAQIQATRPQTLAYGLTDSPIGQLAWIAEKFIEWSDTLTAPEDAIDRDQMLTNVMIYWLTRTAGSSARLYYEHARTSTFGPPGPTDTPTGVAVFPHDIAQPIRRFAERESNIVHWSEFDRGGHFAAMEVPDLLVGDLREFFRPFR